MIAMILAATLIAPSAETGPPLSLANAKRVMAAAKIDAAKRRVSATLVIVDQYGELVLVEAAADAQGAAVDEALVSARSHLDDGSHRDTARAGGTVLSIGEKVVGALSDVGGAAGAVVNAGAEALK